MSTQSTAVEAAKLLDIGIARITGIYGELSAISNYHIVSLVQSTGEYDAAINSSDVQRLSADPQQVIFYPANSSIFLKPSTRFNATSIYIPKHWFETALSSDMGLGGVELQPFIENDDYLAGLANLLSVIAFTPNLQQDPLLIEMLVVRMASRVLRTLASRQTLALPSSPKSGAISKAKLELISDYVEANVHRTIRLPELAELAGMSESHFSRSFRSATGVTAMRFIMSKRVERSKDLLCHTQKTLADIAFECGFASQSHFTTAFKETFGKTPAAFRSDTWWRAAGFSFTVMPALQLLLDYLGA